MLPELAVRDGASFRDPSGFVFHRDGRVLRQVNACYREDYDQLRAGLYDDLVAEGMLLPFEEVDLGLAALAGAHRVLAPERLAFIGHPHEWSFSQLRDAALLTLAIQKKALQRDMSLKDASAYNVQLHDGRVTFIDSLSFERYREGAPWVAYRQFCQHFLAPLALMARTDIRLGQLLRLHLDGIPLDLASALLPWRTRWTWSLGLHVHAHAKSQRRHAGAAPPKGNALTRRLSFSRQAFHGLIESLEAAIRSQEWAPHGGEWTDYYAANHNYGDAGLETKERMLGQLAAAVKPTTAWDLGANTGRMSRVLLAQGVRHVVAWDIDATCVEANYRELRRSKERGLYPLTLDLTNPSPGLGWANAERAGLVDRGPVDLVLALGLVHHLCISNNTPLPMVAQLLAKLGRWTILEWVPKADSQVQKLLATRTDIFDRYDSAGLEEALAPHFEIEQRQPIPNTERTLYLLRSRA